MYEFVDQNFEDFKNYTIERYRLKNSENKIIKNIDNISWTQYIPKSIEEIVDRAGHLIKLESIETLFLT